MNVYDEIYKQVRDRFNSGTGWLSFYKVVDGAVVEKEDNSFGFCSKEIKFKKLKRMMKF